MLAAVSALIGAGALLFARHPTLLAVGVTMVTGVFAGYVTSLLVIPPLHRLWIGTRDASNDASTRKHGGGAYSLD